MKLEKIQLRAIDGVEFSAFRAIPDGPVHAGLVIVQEIFCVNAHIRSVC